MAKQNDPMVDKSVTSSQEEKKNQGESAGWPKPGEEGYVHPDGTKQAEQQLEDNRRAAADRAAAGSILHGAPTHAGNELTEKSEGLAIKRAADPDKAEPGAGYDDPDSRDTTAGE